MEILSFFLQDRPFDQRSEMFYSGGDKSFIEVTRRWIRSGNNIHIVASKHGEFVLKSFGLEGKICTYNPCLTAKELNDLINIKRALMKIPLKRFDFIYCPSEVFTFITCSTIVKRKLKIPMVISINSPITTDIFSTINYVFNSLYPMSVLRRMGRIPGPFFRLVVSNIFMRKADLIFCVGNYIKNLLEKMGVEGKRIFSVGTGIDYDHIQSIRCGEKVFDACFMGSISPMKGIYDLIRLWKMIVEEKPSARLLVMGTGHNYHIKKVRRIINNFRLQQNVILAGFISGDRKYEKLKSSKIFVFPSYLEAMPIAICEAMACRLPIVAYDLPVYKEWFGDYIVRAKIGNLFDLKDKTLFLLEDNNLRDRIEVKGLERVRKYSFDSIANEMMNIITQKLF